MFDLLIKGGLVMDGTGNLGFYAAVGVEGDRVRILRGDITGVEAARAIDATGRIVCPGFIDMHAHSGVMALAEPRHEPKVTQGVTTELIGIDGISYAPIPSWEDMEELLVLNAGLDGHPPLSQRWSTVEEYLSLFDGKAACNFALVIGNSALRICAMGWDDRRRTGEDMERLKAVLRQGMEEGAFGISTGLDYPPGSYADTDELVELSKEANRLGGIYHTHVRYALGDRFLDPFKEAIEIGRRSGIPVHLTHFFHRLPSRGSYRQQLALVDDALKEGLDVTFDSYAHTYGSTRLLIVVPQWVQEGGARKTLERLKSPEDRRRMAREIGPRAPTWHDMWLTYFHQPQNKQWEGKSVAEIAEAMGKDPVDAVIDLLVEENLRTSYVAVGVDPMTIPEFYQHPAAMVGSDALLIGDYPSPRSYGTFTEILGELVREGGYLELREAIRKMTSCPAQRLGLRDRGLLRDGTKADIVVFDPKTVRSPATHRNPKQFSEGIDYVIVNGTPVIAEGKHTGALPGRALRRGQA